MLSGFVHTQKALLSYTTLRLIPERDHKSDKGLSHNKTAFSEFELVTIG